MFVPSSYLEATHRFNLGGVDDIFMVTGHANSTTLNPAVAAEVISAQFSTFVDSVMSSDIIYTETRVIDGDNGEGFWTPGVVGGQDPGSAPPAVCAYVRKRSGLTTPGSRGAMYVPGIREADITSAGFLTAGLFTDLVAACDQLRFDLDDNDVPMVVLHSTSGPVPSLVTQLFPSNHVATQKRRNNRR